MNSKDWKKRIAERSDITVNLVHLTKPCSAEVIELSAPEVLMKILKDRCIQGSTTESGFICGKRKAVCFQEAPLYSIAQNIYYEQKLRDNNKSIKARYLGIGLSFEKPYVYNKEGRPAIYDKTSAAKEYFPKSEWWRIVNLDLKDEDNFIDWTHEREWRVPDKLEFELSEVTVLVPNEEVYKCFIKKCDPKILDEIRSVVNIGALFY